MSTCTICSKNFKNERGLRIHITRMHGTKQEESPVKGATKEELPIKVAIDSLTTRLPDTVLLDQILPMLDVYTVANLLVTNKSMHKLTASNDGYWRNLLKTSGLFIKNRPYPEYQDQPGLVFLRLACCDEKKRRRCCFSCLTSTTKMHYWYQIPICIDCQRDEDEYRSVTRSTAISEYGLKGKEVDALSYLSVQNPHYRSAAPMKLCLLQDVLDAQGSRDVEAIQLKRLEAARKRKQTVTNKMEARKEQLEKALWAKGLSLRSDSELCKHYVNGTGTMPLNAVVEEMAFMKYLYEYTDYETRVEEAVEEEGEWKGFYPGIWREMADIMKMSYKRPSVWPWLVGETP